MFRMTKVLIPQPPSHKGDANGWGLVLSEVTAELSAQLLEVPTEVFEYLIFRHLCKYIISA